MSKALENILKENPLFHQSLGLHTIAEENSESERRNTLHTVSSKKDQASAKASSIPIILFTPPKMQAHKSLVWGISEERTSLGDMSKLTRDDLEQELLRIVELKEYLGLQNTDLSKENIELRNRLTDANRMPKLSSHDFDAKSRVSNEIPMELKKSLEENILGTIEHYRDFCEPKNLGCDVPDMVQFFNDDVNKIVCDIVSDSNKQHNRYIQEDKKAFEPPSSL